MPSPLPGMDPYIEAPNIWSDFHGDVAAAMRAELNRVAQCIRICSWVQLIYKERLAPL
jgi:hypothetical protein